MQPALPDHHQEVVDRFTAACRDDDRIIAAFLGGSYAHGAADQYSDVDLYFITTDAAYDEFLVERSAFVRRLGEPLFLEDFGLEHGYCFILANGAEGEVWFGCASRYNHIHGGPYRALVDKNGLLAGAVFPGPVADAADQVATLQQQLDWYWHELAHFIKAMGRRQLWFAMGQLEVMRQICVSLARMSHDFADEYAGKEPYFKLDQALPGVQLSPLQTTFCPMEYGAMVQAGRAVCHFYRDVAPKLASQHDLTYQVALELLLLGQLEELAGY